MIILTIRTDKPEAEIALYDDEKQLIHETWIAHRELAETIHKKLSKLLTPLNKSLDDISGIVCFKGPGSFTGLRIGITVANALAYAEDVPIVAKESQGWQAQGIKALLSGQNYKIALPDYGAEAKTTKPRK
jgi:tRNA threonylcarbamoyladenosine biosynthesis protein TsaB